MKNDSMTVKGEDLRASNKASHFARWRPANGIGKEQHSFVVGRLHNKGELAYTGWNDAKGNENHVTARGNFGHWKRGLTSLAELWAGQAEDSTASHSRPQSPWHLDRASPFCPIVPHALREAHDAHAYTYFRIWAEQAWWKRTILFTANI